MSIIVNKVIEYVERNVNTLIEYSPKLVTAFFILVVGHYAIKIFKKLVNRKALKREFEPTLSKFLIDILIWLLRVLLFVTFISKLGIETASFVAIIGAAGLAIGLSLQGSLSNFAGGILIILFKPFEVGDSIEAQGVSGTVLEIQIFVTKLLTGNNQTIFIPNGSLSNGNIINHSLEGTRRADLSISVSYDADLKKTKEIIMTVLTQNEKILQEPASSVEVSALTETSVKLAIRPWANNEDFSKVCAETLENCKTELGKAGIVIEKKS
ncbi:small conductance mechanosensitive channel [Flavobacterium swingsii]|uniref:Small conductance mechanosensitive channel n=1 Tax=Flavobacterium swingsii TaxID=498292 RepID=A0A1I0Z777_9FLAO|nr:mechanosensitive ion channel domain-containing protein [Flavobacterium swingsii]SFB21609.1 small conductance mechanosensitive channel [Flavobacterium swingsii]